MPRKMPAEGRRSRRPVRQVKNLDETALELAKIRQAEGYKEEQSISETTPRGKRTITLGKRGEKYGPYGFGQMEKKKRK